MKPLHVVVVLSLVLAAASPAFSQTRFSDVDPYLGDAANWQPLHAARWSVVMDGGGLRYGIDTTSYSERSGSRLGEYSLVKGRTYGDFVLSARVRSTEDFAANGWADHDVVFGLQDGDNYYYAMVSRYAPFTQLFKVVAGQRQTLANSTYAIPDNDYHQIEVSRAGSLITVKADGAVIMQADDATFGPGRVGIGSFDDAALWDDIAIAGPFSTLDPYLGDAVNWEPSNASRWSVVMDGGDLRYGITTKTSELPGSRLGAYSLAKGRTYGDFVLSARARSTEDFTANPWADHDVMFGFQDANNYYYAMFNRYAPFTQLFKVVGGVRQTLADSTYAIPDNDYHQIEVSRAGSLITVKADGAVIMQANDATFGAGRVGVGSFDDGALWDDITITVPLFSTLDRYLGDAANWLPLNAARWSLVMDGGDLRYGITAKTPELPGSRLGAYSLVNGRTYGDFVFSTRARSTEDFAANGWADHDVVFGLQDTNNYYYAMFNRYAPFTQLFKVVAGQRQTLADGNYAIPDNDYHQFEVSRVGSLITVKADGAVIMQANDATFGAGRVGVGSFDDAALWDDITVSVPSAPVAVPLPPTISFSAVPSMVAAGQSATMTWSSTNATSCSASDGWSGTLPTSGSQAVAPSATTTYILTCMGAGGVALMSALVTVTTLMPAVSLAASPASIVAGASSTLTWSATGAGSCTASGGWSGTKATSGSQAVSPSSTTNYALSCTGAGGTASQSATVMVAAAGQITQSLVPSRVSGVAPLYVFFDATATTAQATTRPFHDLEYRWDFGDAASGSWTSTPGMPNTSRNSDTGPVAAHVFESPGTYTVRLTVLDGIGVATKSVQITVADPDTVFAANTLCVGNSLPVAGSGGCPAGAAVLASGDFDATINNNLASRKRILFQRGDSFSSSASAFINLDGPGLIGAFGSGAAPAVSITANNNAFQLSSGSTPTIKDWRFMDLEINGNSGAATAGFWVEGGIDQVTLLRMNIHHMHYGVLLSPDKLDFYGGAHRLWDQWAVVDSTVRNAIGGGGGYVLYFSGQRCAVMGNVLRDSSLAEHVLRMPYIFKGVFSHNDMSKQAAAKHVVKMQAASWFSAAPTPYTEQIVFSDNKFTAGAGGSWTVTIGPMDNQHDERVKQVILERNWFAPDPGQTDALMLWAQEVTVRNNIFNLTGASRQDGIVVEQRGIEPLPANVHVYNNTFYSNSTGDFRPIQFFVGTGMEAKNNLGYAPLSTSRDMVVGSAIIQNNTTDAGILVSPEFLRLTPVVPADFALGAASSAIKAGTAVPVFSDFFRLERPPAGPFDLGAVESP